MAASWAIWISLGRWKRRARAQRDVCQLTLRRPRELDDAELDSGDDMDRNDRAPEQEDAPTQQFEEQTINTMDIEITRQPLPEPSDGEVWNVPLRSEKHTLIASSSTF